MSKNQTKPKKKKKRKPLRSLSLRLDDVGLSRKRRKKKEKTMQCDSNRFPFPTFGRKTQQIQNDDNSVENNARIAAIRIYGYGIDVFFFSIYKLKNESKGKEN
jgi:hypothetical protein